MPRGAKALTAQERQKEILQASAAPGVSRHHWGTDFDLFDPGMNPADWEVGGAFADEYSWLRRNASTYGFIQPFTSSSGGYGTGYIEERWHWSYYPIAQALLEFVRAHQTDIDNTLQRLYRTRSEYTFIRKQWRAYMMNVGQRGVF